MTCAAVPSGPGDHLSVLHAYMQDRLLCPSWSFEHSNLDLQQDITTKGVTDEVMSSSAVFAWYALHTESKAFSCTSLFCLDRSSVRSSAPQPHSISRS